MLETEGGTIKRVDAQSYDPVADQFDDLTDVYSTSIAARMVEHGHVDASSKVLDVGTGTGLITRTAGQRSNHVLGIDQSAGMLARARQRAQLDGLSDRVRFAAMDAEALDLADASFDVVLCLYVIRHLPDPAAAVAEMKRVLKRGGRAVIATGARPHLGTLAGAKDGLSIGTDRLLEKVGRRALAPTHLRRFLEQQDIRVVQHHAAHTSVDIATLLKNAGFSSVRRHWWSKRYELSPNEFWMVQSVFDSTARAMLTSLDPELVTGIKEKYLAHLNELASRGTTFVYRTGADIFVAVA